MKRFKARVSCSLINFLDKRKTNTRKSSHPKGKHTANAKVYSEIGCKCADCSILMSIHSSMKTIKWVYILFLNYGT